MKCKHCNGTVLSELNIILRKEELRCLDCGREHDRWGYLVPVPIGASIPPNPGPKDHYTGVRNTGRRW